MSIRGAMGAVEELVTSVFSRVGDIIAQVGDYIASQVTRTATPDISATDVDSALQEVVNERAAIKLDGAGGGEQKFLNLVPNGNVTIATALDAGNSRINASFSAGGGGGGLTNIKLSAGTLSQLRSDITFNNSNGVSFGLETNGIITGTVKTDYLTNINVSAGTTSNNRSNVTFADSNGISFGLNAGTITGTVKTDYLTSQSNQALSGSNGSFTFQTATFGNLNGMSFYTSNGSMVGSYTVPTQSVQTQNMIVLEVNGANGTGTFSSGTVDVHAGNNVTLSTGANAFSIHGGAGGAGGGGTLDQFEPFVIQSNMSAFSNATWSYLPIEVKERQESPKIAFLLSCGTASGSTAGIQFSAGLYTRTGSTLSLSTSGSASSTWTSGTNAVGNWGGVSGVRLHTCNANATLTAGQYWLGVAMRSSNAGTFSIFGMSTQAFSGQAGAATNQSQQLALGYGYRSVSSSEAPASVAISDLIGTGMGQRFPWALFYNFSV